MIDQSQLTTLQRRVIDYITTNKAAAHYDTPDTVYIDIPRYVIVQAPGEELQCEDEIIDLQMIQLNFTIEDQHIHTTLLNSVELPSDIDFQYIRIIIKSLIFSKL